MVFGAIAASYHVTRVLVWTVDATKSMENVINVRRITGESTARNPVR